MGWIYEFNKNLTPSWTISRSFGKMRTNWGRLGKESVLESSPTPMVEQIELWHISGRTPPSNECLYRCSHKGFLAGKSKMLSALSHFQQSRSGKPRRTYSSNCNQLDSVHADIVLHATALLDLAWRPLLACIVSRAGTTEIPKLLPGVRELQDEALNKRLLCKDSLNQGSLIRHLL